MRPLLQCEQLSFMVGSQSNHPILQDVSLSIDTGQWCSILGANGAGKTTLLHLLDGDLSPSHGQVLWQQKNLNNMDRLVLARQRAVLPQLLALPFPMTVRELIEMGREPYYMTPAQPYNSFIINKVIQWLELQAVVDQPYHLLSGGEQQRVQIARCMAQIVTNSSDDLSGKVLFLDEPNNHLDLRHQYALMHLLKTLQLRGLCIVMVLHDIAMAIQHSDHIALLKSGQLLGQYSPADLIENHRLTEAYEMNIQLEWMQTHQRFMVVAQPV